MYKPASPQRLGGSSLRAAIGCILDSGSPWIKFKLSSAVLHFFFPFFLKKMYLLIFSCARSLLLHNRLFSCFSPWGLLLFSLVLGCRFSLQWLLLSRGTASRHEGFSSCGSRALKHKLSRCSTLGLSCSVACGIFLEQKSNLCPLHWQADF